MTTEEKMAQMCPFCGSMVPLSGGVGTVLDWHCQDCDGAWTPYENFPPRDEYLAEVLKEKFAEHEGQRPVALGSLYFTLEAKIKQFRQTSRNGRVKIEGRACNHLKAEFLAEALEFLQEKYGHPYRTE